jgi:class 3 adenylate cyclase/tetratricopeptide (TPR) repeat protein
VGERVERKIVTILFCDLVGFTATFDLADPEDVQDALARYHARMLREIERFGGTVEKFIGDAVMAVYGAPIAREDDAQRAVLSALRIPPAIEELNEAHPEISMAVRVGIETGEAVVTLGGEQARRGMAIGDVVNTASRLQGIAPIGGVLVGERTYRLTQDLFVFETLEPVTVKGKAAPLRVWVAKSARSRFGAELQRSASTPLVDREDELELLKRTYARAVREPSVQLATLMGEPGVGKSRVIKEFFAYLDDRPELVAWRHGRCLPYGEGVTFWALGQIVKAHAGILESDDAQEARAKLTSSVDALVDEPTEREWVRARLAPLIGLDEPGAEGIDRTETFSAWRSFLEAIATRTPLVVAIEDVHWADGALLGFVEHLLEWSSGVPMLILCSARPELFERAPSWGGGKRNSSTVTLPPLSDADTERLISSLLPPESLPTVRDVLIERAGGNPLFAEEFVHMLLDRAAQASPGAGSGDTILDVPPPETLHAIIAARLDALPVEQKSLLEDASVVGGIFWPGALVAIGGFDPEVVRSWLHELTRSELVRPSRVSSVKDEQEYAFAHGLIRDVAYGLIPREPRAEKHVSAANWIEELAGERVSEYAETLAHHYGRASELARSAGIDATELEAAARRYFVMAGDRAMNLDVAGAEAWFDRALLSLPAGHPDRADVLSKKGETSFSAGRYQMAQHLYEEALAEFEQRGDLPGAGACLDWLATVLWEQGDTEGSRARLTKAVEVLEQEDPGPELAACYSSVASERLITGHFEEAVQWSERSLELVGALGSERLRPRALSFRGMASCYLGDLGGLEDIREAVEITERLGLSRENARDLVMLAEVVWASDSPTRALEATQTGADLAGRRGLDEMLLGCQTTSLGPLFDLGKWDEVLKVADDVIGPGGEAGGDYAAIMAMPWKAQVLLWRGQKAAAESVASELVLRARQIRDPQVLVPAFVASALVSMHGGDAGAAMQLLGDLEETTQVRIDWYREQCIADLVRICAAADDLSMARRFLERSRAFTMRHRLSVLTARAAFAEALGNVEEASRGYEEATKGWTGYGHILEMGNALLGAGRCHARMGHSDAGDRFHRARELFEGLGAVTMVTEVVDRVNELPDSAV